MLISGLHDEESFETKNRLTTQLLGITYFFSLTILESYNIGDLGPPLPGPCFPTSMLGRVIGWIFTSPPNRDAIVTTRIIAILISF